MRNEQIFCQIFLIKTFAELNGQVQKNLEINLSVIG
jgi:hypothetical protein